MNKERKNWSKGAIVEHISNLATNKITDIRKRVSKYRLTDFFMSVFGVFDQKISSLHEYEGLLNDTVFVDNMKNLYLINHLPSDTQIRERLDVVDSKEIQKIFNSVISKFQQDKLLEVFRYYKDEYLLAIDGTQHFRSSTIHCACCSVQKNNKTGIVKSYYHSILHAVIVNPSINQCLPIISEPMSSKDGDIKSDCELNAIKRLLKKVKNMHPHLKFTVTLDALFAVKPIIDLLNECGFNYITVTKNQYLHNNIGPKNSESFVVINNNVECNYTFANDMPLNKSHQDVKVNYLKYTESKSINFNKVQFISLPNNPEILDYMNEYDNPMIINKEGNVYVKSDRSVSTILYCKEFNDTTNNFKKDIKYNLSLTSIFQKEIDSNSEFAIQWKSMQEINKDVTTTEKLYHKNVKGDIFVYYNEQLKKSSDGLLPKIKEIFKSYKFECYYNEWITNIEINRENATLIMQGGRSKWMIENETFNALKNQGYNYEHNYGHGYTSLSNNLSMIMMLVFLVNQIEAFVGYYYELLRKKFKTKKLFNKMIKSNFIGTVFTKWQDLYIYMLKKMNLNLESTQ